MYPMFPHCHDTFAADGRDAILDEIHARLDRLERTKAPSAAAPAAAVNTSGIALGTSSGAIAAAYEATAAYVPKIEQCIRDGRCLSGTIGSLKTQVPVAATKGKVRDIYATDDQVFLVATDRQSAFDRHLASVPFKGQVLSMVSQWWFGQTGHIINNHVVSVPHPNVTVCRKCTIFPIEFVVRGYITGSTDTAMWTHYNNGCRDYCGIALPEGLQKNQKLWDVLVTPTTKSTEHDECISPAEIVSRGFMTKAEFDTCKEKALEVFNFASAKAAERGLILVDTKFEFGKDESGAIVLADEILTPDSSRYWIADTYNQCMAEGRAPENIDKEFLRLWFRSVCDPYKDETLPDAPLELVVELSRRYIMLFEVMTGRKFGFAVSSSGAIQNSLHEVSPQVF